MGEWLQNSLRSRAGFVGCCSPPGDIALHAPLLRKISSPFYSPDSLLPLDTGKEMKRSQPVHFQLSF